MRNHMRRFIALALSLILCLSMGIQAFAVENNHGTQNAATETEDMYVAAQQAYDYLTDEQKEAFITQITLLALAGDSSLVEFHQTYVDPSYEFNPEDYAAVPNVANAASVAGQLQALNLPTAVYYGLLAFATSLGIPVGNVVDLVVGLGLGVIILANWDAIANVWDDIIDIFVDAFGSVVLDAFDYIASLFESDTDAFNESAEEALNNVDDNKKHHILENKLHDHKWSNIFGGRDPDWNELLPILIRALKEGVETVFNQSGDVYERTIIYQGYEVVVRFVKAVDGTVKYISTAYLK